MNRPDVTIVHACTRDGEGGSPTAVIIDDDTREDRARAIVRDVGTSHAAFIRTGSPPTVRFFTAERELVNCGHGTIAAQAFLLHRSGTATHHGRQTTGGRTFDTTATRRGDGIEVWFDQGTVTLMEPHPAALGSLLAALGVNATDLSEDDSPQVASAGTPRLLVPVSSERLLLSLRPDLPRLAAECRRLGYLGCFVYVSAGVRDHAVARMFAPAIGVDEDIVNANSAGCLAAHYCGRNGRAGIQVDQGHTAGRPSVVLATATATTTDAIRVRLGGTAVVQA